MGTPARAANSAHGADSASPEGTAHEKVENGKKTTSKPDTGHKPDTGFSDATIIDYLRHHQTVSVADLVEFTGVTATAVRQRLGRLMGQGWVTRQTAPGQPVGRQVPGRRDDEAGQPRRGRPTHRYSLTHAGSRSSGSNFEDLASALWLEIRDSQEPEVRRGFLRRIVTRLIEHYRDQVQGSTLRERMNSLVALMDARAIPFEVDFTLDETALPDQLPTLTALACPYPDLAEQDRMICALEKMLFSEMLGKGLTLTACRLDGDTCCTFEAHEMLSGQNTNKEPLYDTAMD